VKPEPNGVSTSVGREARLHPMGPAPAMGGTDPLAWAVATQQPVDLPPTSALEDDVSRRLVEPLPARWDGVAHGKVLPCA
jgi:hypothetical protein